MLSARLKVLGNLDIAERRLPQDGQFTIELTNEPVSFRIATLPATAVRKLCCASADQVQQASEPKALGMSAEQLACFTASPHQPQGLILVTGPTGSGKTVTLL